MRDTDLFQLALGLVPPWMVKACNFDAEARRLDIAIDFAKGGRFACPHCAKAGYRSTRTLKAITYLIAGKLDLKLPT